MKRAALFLALSLSACASGSDPAPALPRYYIDYKAYIIEQLDMATMGGPNASAPGPVKFAFEDCAANATVAQYTTQQRATLDAYARREISLTNQQLADINASVRAKFGDHPSIDRMYQEMGKFCPNDIPVFRRTLKSE